MSLGCEPRMIVRFLIVFTGTPAECGEQSKHRTLSPVSELRVDNCTLSRCWSVWRVFLTTMTSDNNYKKSNFINNTTH